MVDWIVIVIVVRVVVAVALAGVVLFVGIGMLRAVGVRRDGGRDVDEEPEDVADLDVYLVCGECGTEFQVTRLGEVQVPRHCGERMQVVQRPLGGGPAISMN